MAYTTVPIVGTFTVNGELASSGTVAITAPVGTDSEGTTLPNRSYTLVNGSLPTGANVPAYNDPGTYITGSRISHTVKITLEGHELPETTILVRAGQKAIDLSMGVEVEKAPEFEEADPAFSDLKVFNVVRFGAKGDGSTDDSAAIQGAIEACGDAGGGTVYIPAGTYKIGEGLVVDSSNVRIEGAGRGSTILEKTGDFDLITVKGATGSEDHVTDCAVELLTLRGGDNEARLLNVMYATRFVANQLHLFGNQGPGIDTAEVWDSRFTDCWVEWCSTSDEPAVWVRSSQAATGEGSSTDSTNQILFHGLLVEAWRGGAVWVEAGLGNPEGLYSIHFYGSKIETHQVGGVAIKVPDGSSNVSFVDTYLYLDAFADGYSTPVAAIELTGYACKLDGCYIGTGDEVLTTGVYLDGGAHTLSNVEGNYYNGAPSLNNHVTVNGGSGYTFHHLRAENVDTMVAGLSDSVQALPAHPVPLVDGAVHDGRFSVIPPVGTIAIDSTNGRVYVKSGEGKWEFLELS